MVASEHESNLAGGRSLNAERKAMEMPLRGTEGDSCCELRVLLAWAFGMNCLLNAAFAEPGEGR